MARRLMLLVAAISLVSPMNVVAAQATGAAPLEVQQSDTITSVLRKHVGKRVTLRLEAGEEMTGTVKEVGEHVVHLSELAGRDYYDAVVDLDDVAAVVVRVR